MPLNVFSRMQITVPAEINDGENWATFESQRKTAPFKNNLNEMPPGMQLDNPSKMPLSLAGQTDYSADANREALTEGCSILNKNGSY